VRRWDSSDGKFKTEREARRAGLTGKLTKHPGQGPDPTDSPSPRANATTYEREADPDSLADTEEDLEEEENAD
jgi:hypothetical protein